MSTARGHLARNTLIVGGAFSLAAGLALVRNMVIARQFGINADLDVYYAAFKVPELLFTLVAGGALATAFVPVLSAVLATEGRKATWRLASAVSNIVFLAAAILSALAALLAPWLVRNLVAPGFSPDRQAQTASVMVLALISTLVFALSALQTGVLHSFKHFLAPALAPVLYPLGVIAGALDLPVVLRQRGADPEVVHQVEDLLERGVARAVRQVVR